MVKNIMAIGAHPDDIEVGCFGTLLYNLDKGDNLIVVITTKGGYFNRSLETIKSEYKCAENILDVKYIMLDNPIANYEFNWNTVNEIDEIIDSNNIDTVYCNWYGDAHQDHQATFKNVFASARKNKIKNLYCYGLDEYCLHRSNLQFSSRLYVDITKYFDKKMKAIKCYSSYFNNESLDAIESLMHYRGMFCGAKYAEAFEIIFETWR